MNVERLGVLAACVIAAIGYWHHDLDHTQALALALSAGTVAGVHAHRKRKKKHAPVKLPTVHKNGAAP